MAPVVAVAARFDTPRGTQQDRIDSELSRQVQPREESTMSLSHVPLSPKQHGRGMQ